MQMNAYMGVVGVAISTNHAPYANEHRDCGYANQQATPLYANEFHMYGDGGCGNQQTTPIYANIFPHIWGSWGVAVRKPRPLYANKLTYMGIVGVAICKSHLFMQMSFTYMEKVGVTITIEPHPFMQMNTYWDGGRDHQQTTPPLCK